MLVFVPSLPVILATSITFGTDVLASTANTSNDKKEPHIFVSPNDSNKLMGAWIDYNLERCRIGLSIDGGATWPSGGQVYPQLPSGLSASYDPSLTAIGTTWYISCVGHTDTLYSSGDTSKIFYATSINDGATWTPIVVKSKTYPALADKPWIAQQSGYVYMCWAELDNWADWNNNLPTGIHIKFQQQKPAVGLEIPIADGTASKGNSGNDSLTVQGCHIAINGNGVVYVLWANNFSADSGQINLAKSFNHGSNWDAVQHIKSYTKGPESLGTDCLDEFGCVPGVGGKAFRNPNFPYVAIDSSNVLHLTYWSYDTTNADYNLRYVKISNCTTMGVSCTTSSSLCVTCTGDSSHWDQFMPSITYSSTANAIYITGLDRRDDPSDIDWRPYIWHCHLSTDCTQSSNWDGPQRISSTSSNNLGGVSFIGDYRGSTSTSARQDNVLWPDTRAVNQVPKFRIWFDRTST